MCCVLKRGSPTSLLRMDSVPLQQRAGSAEPGCNSCGACVDACQKLTKHGQLFMDLEDLSTAYHNSPIQQFMLTCLAFATWPVLSLFSASSAPVPRSLFGPRPAGPVTVWWTSCMGNTSIWRGRGQYWVGKLTVTKTPETFAELRGR